jgi:hypothetical protein
MATIYMKSKDEKMVGSFRGKGAGLPGRTRASLEKEGWVQIDQAEFRRLKARILHRMLKSDDPEDHIETGRFSRSG